jgi:hypothetical protein
VKNEEWWVMRVVADRDAVSELHGVQHPSIDEWNRKLESGDICYVSGELCEPVEVYRDQESASIRAAKEHARTGCVHKIVLNAEV